MPATTPVHLTAQWTLLEGREQEGLAALRKLAAAVLANEPDTLVYSFHTPLLGSGAPASLPTPNPGTVLFYEAYASAEAFQAHVNGPVFKQFLQDHGDLFLCTGKQQPFVIVQFLQLQAGFTRQPGRVDGVALYRITPGLLDGRWTAGLPGFNGQTGIELAERPGSSQDSLPGDYHVRIWSPGHSTSQPTLFDGTLSILALPGGPDPELASYQLQWTTPHSSEAYTGIGLHRKGSDQLSVSYWNAPPPGPAQSSET
ncbi:MAG TPA: antibiotic biosynthesis monooxygenase family protein [Myxococcaceae bacterium]|jgi:quinol monooxygenase YgiN